MSGTAPVVAMAGVNLRRDGQLVLEDISMEVGPGEFAGICGPNGAGKTTLLKAVLGIIPIDTGRIEVLGDPPERRRGAGHGVGYVPQRHAIPANFPATVLDVVLMGNLRRRRSRRDGGQAAEEILRRIGILDLKDRPVGRLSGGQQRRVVLAQALCASERLLILDEPTVGLDLPAEQEFYALVRRLQHELGLAVIVVSHDLVALAGEADRLFCINRRMHVHGHPEDVVHSHALREAYSCEFDFLAGEIDHHGRHGPSH